MQKFCVVENGNFIQNCWEWQWKCRNGSGNGNFCTEMGVKGNQKLIPVDLYLARLAATRVQYNASCVTAVVLCLCV